MAWSGQAYFESKASSIKEVLSLLVDMSMPTTNGKFTVLGYVSDCVLLLATLLCPVVFQLVGCDLCFFLGMHSVN